MGNSIHHSLNQFLTNDECEYALKFCEDNGENFSYKLNTSWDCKRINDENFKNWVSNKISSLYESNSLIFWFDYSNYDIKNINISLTKYYDGRYLALHLDKTSKYTTVIPLTDGYEDGRFVLSEDPNKKVEDCDLKIDIKKGQGLTFEGTKTYHGVMPVYNGVRCSLNIWLSEHEYPILKFEKTLL